MHRRQRTVGEDGLVPRYDEVRPGLGPRRREVGVFEVCVARGIEGPPKRGPVHESELEQRFDGLEERTRIDVVVSRGHLPTGGKRGRRHEPDNRSPVDVRQKFQGPIVMRTARDGGVKEHVRVEENAHRHRKATWR